MFEGNSSGLGVRKQASRDHFVRHPDQAARQRPQMARDLGRLPTSASPTPAGRYRCGPATSRLASIPTRSGRQAAAEREAKREAEAAAKAKAEADEFTLRMLLRKWDHLALVHRRKSYAVKALRSIEKTFPKMVDSR